ncbi:hypothetical protein B4U80_08501 [Leptotrombidium deliense]|uniref:Carbohydrate kinase FGGY N-terminal domain-containing protein n=1 Tax=Leptotrombidium deliense TaxID=299467 RepID=A0A443SKV1_9ACAR|nr:hypothetical protein B4U80_08501 [Leptotrombidium deliense]
MNVISADVGSNSVRVAITHFSRENCGRILANVSKEITVHSRNSRIYEQNTAEIWKQLCACIKECLRKSNLDYTTISGIAFTATCSLVVVEKK